MLSKIVDLEKYSSSVIPITNEDYSGDGSKILRDLNGDIRRDGFGNPITDKGLVYCGHCHTLKQTRIYSQACRRLFEPYCLCNCLQDNEKKLANEFKKRRQQIDIEHNLRNADKLMLKNTFSKDKYPDSDVGKFCRSYCRDWVKNNKPKNIGLYIYGDVGTGKSFYASCIANEVARVFGDTVKMISTTRIVNDLFSLNDKSSYIDELAMVDLLVIDDLGAERKTEFTAEQLYSVIDERYKAQKPLIVTSNISYDALRQTDDINYKRINDRIIDICLPVYCQGKSKRGLFG